MSPASIRLYFIGLACPIFEEFAMARVRVLPGGRGASGTIIRPTEVREDLWREPVALHWPMLVTHGTYTLMATCVFLLALRLMFVRRACCFYMRPFV